MYRPPFCTQWWLASDGVDDCRVVATLHLVLAATNGELGRTSAGREIGKYGLKRIAAQMRKSLDDPRTAVIEHRTGGLGTDEAQRMVKRMWGWSLSVPEITFNELLDQLAEGFVFTVSGQGARITNPQSKLRRTRTGHELYLDRLNKDRTKILVYDGYRNADIDQRGEWIPVKEVRQFASAYKDGDGDVTCTRVKRGAWSEAGWIKKHLAEEIARLRERKAQLKAALATSREAHEALRLLHDRCVPAEDDNAAVRMAMLDMAEERVLESIKADFAELRDDAA